MNHKVHAGQGTLNILEILVLLDLVEMHQDLVEVVMDAFADPNEPTYA